MFDSDVWNLFITGTCISLINEFVFWNIKTQLCTHNVIPRGLDNSVIALQNVVEKMNMLASLLRPIVYTLEQCPFPLFHFDFASSHF